MIQITKSSLFCLLGLSTVLAAQGEVDLRLQAKKGASVWLTQETKLQQLIDMGGQEMETGRNVTTVLHLTVKDVDDNGMLLAETKSSHIHGTMTMPTMGDVEFDSVSSVLADDDNDDANGFGMPSMGQIAKSQTALAGKSFVAMVGPDGKVASFQGVDELLKAGKGGNPMAQAGPTEAELRTLVESSFGHPPEKPLAIGASWDHKVKEGGGMPSVTMKLTLAKVESDAFEVTSTGTIEEPKKGEGDANDPRQKMMESLKISNSKATGLQRISRQDGFVLDSAQTVSMDATMDSPMGGEMSMKVKATTSVKRTTAEAAVPAKAEPVKAEPVKTDAPK